MNLFYENPTPFLQGCIAIGEDGEDDILRWRSEDCIVMQSTGLLDKNRNEIFEGDILSPSNRAVLWKDGFGANGAGFYTKCHCDEYPPVPFTFGRTQADASEIIGNIYQNPELLS